MATVHVFGDTGGHGLQLFKALSTIGVDLETGEIPEGVIIVHLGDLIHKGPASNTIVSMVDKLIRNNPGQWLQVLGNHEFQHIEEGIDFWNCSCTPDTQATIQEWYSEGLARVAWAIEGVLPNKWTTGNRPVGQEELVGSFLATHGGLTYPLWKKLGEPDSATLAADRLNAKRSWCAGSAGEMLGMTNRYGMVGPVWAMASKETFHYWHLEWLKSHLKMPFGQLVGHNAPFSFDSGNWWGNVSKDFRKVSKVNLEDRRTVCFVAESVLICMDPDYTKDAVSIEQPFLKFEIEEL